jgi:hypothetical protein
MRFDPETGDNVYDIPAELSPVIEELTKQNNDMKDALLEIWQSTRRYKGHFSEEIRELVPHWLRPLQ